MTDLAEQPPSPGTDIEEIETRIEAADNEGVVVGNLHGDLIVQLARLRRMEKLEREYVDAVLRSYVDRPLFDGALTLDTAGAGRRLRERHCLVLLGEPGAGRRTTAVALLGRLDVPLHKVPDWEPGQSDQFTAADLPATPGAGYLFVHPDGDTASTELGHQLRAYREKLAAAGSFLVVVATPSAWNVTGESWHDVTFTVGALNRQRLLAAHVRLLSPRPDLAPIFLDPRIEDVVARATPRDVVRLAGLVARTTQTDGADLDPEHAAAEILGAYQEWTAHLEGWFDRHRQAGDRLFLLAAAVLETSPAGRVLRLAEELGDLMEGKQPARNSITTAGIRELARTVGAHLEGRDNRLHFDRPAYASSVLDYFLADRSDGFRADLLTWLKQAPKAGHQAEAAEIAEQVAASVLGVVLRRRDLGLALGLASSWAGSKLLRPSLVALLTAVALSPEAGPRMRARLNQWATQSSSPAVWELIADVCTGDLADAYPRVALTRIKNLALRADATRAPIVVDAVRRLWAHPALRGDLLERLVEWLGEPDTPAFGVAVQAIAGLNSETIRQAYAQSLTGPALSSALGNVIELLDQIDELRETVHGWLDAGLADELFADWLIAALTAAMQGPGSARRITGIRTFADGWESREPSPTRAAFRERLMSAVSDRIVTMTRWARAAQQKEAIDGQLV
jgi:hypothetical protein